MTVRHACLLGTLLLVPAAASAEVPPSGAAAPPSAEVGPPASPREAASAPPGAPASADAPASPADVWLTRKLGVSDARRVLRALQAEDKAQRTAASAVREARAAYWLGLNLEDAKAGEEVRKAAWEGCRKAGLAAQQRDAKEAGGYFWEAVCRAKLAELRGIAASAWELSDLLDLMDKVEKLEPGYGYGGTARYWGTVITRTPGFLLTMQGHSLDDGEEFFEKSLIQAPEYVGTWLLYADLELRREQPDRARAYLTKAVRAPKAKDPDIEAWNVYYRKQARGRLAELKADGG